MVQSSILLYLLAFAGKTFSGNYIIRIALAISLINIVTQSHRTKSCVLD